MEKDNEELLQGIAIIGLAGRFPESNNVDQYWENLQAGKNCIRSFEDEDLTHLDSSLVNNKNYVKKAGVIEDAFLFDAEFFNYTPKEAEVTDIQNRLFLEACWEALENAGYDPERFDGNMSVFAGSRKNEHYENIKGNNDIYKSIGSLQAALSTHDDFLATNVSYKLNLRGASMTVQTACSTSLVAVHQACQSLLLYESDIALAGGVSVDIQQHKGYIYQEGSIMSADGVCRTFDANANGTVGGNGLGVVVLKRLEDAVRDKDNIEAVIKGSAINNDGAGKVGFTAPSVNGQARVITDALNIAGIKPESISYVEVHGTGTKLGDPIEFAALNKALNSSKDPLQSPCALGSVKTNIGHLDAAAGIAGLIKVVLAIKHKALPATLNFVKPNPEMNLEKTRFYVNTKLKKWTTQDNRPLLAGVSSFGIGGTNAHVILEEPPIPPVEEEKVSAETFLLPISARSETALNNLSEKFTKYFEKNKSLNLSDVSNTLQAGRKVMPFRRVVTGQNINEIITQLKNERKYVISRENKRNVIFMFPGQGSQYVNMGYDLYHSEKSFKKTVDYCNSVLIETYGINLLPIVYPQKLGSEESLKINQTYITQLVLFVIEYATAKLLMEKGVTPKAMIGHSIGEYVAACLSGVFSLEEALDIVATRGQLMQSLPSGKMLSVTLPISDVVPFLNEMTSIAAVNAKNSCVLSGEEQYITELENTLKEAGVTCKILNTSHAFHSNMMDPILEKFESKLKEFTFNKPEIPFISNVTGKWITDLESLNPQYWSNHLRNTVNFSKGIETLDNHEQAIYLEVGPGNSLSNLVKQFNSNLNVFSCIRRVDQEAADDRFLVSAIGQLWMHGLNIDLQKLNSRKAKKVPLPTYPFEKQYYYVNKNYSNTLDVKEQKVQLENKSKNNELTSINKEKIEQGIIEVWESSFGKKNLTKEDNFFELGGNSLLAIHILSQLRNYFDIDLGIDKLFESPVIKELAHEIQFILSGEDADIDDILGELKNMSLHEVEVLLNKN